MTGALRLIARPPRRRPARTAAVLSLVLAGTVLAGCDQLTRQLADPTPSTPRAQPMAATGRDAAAKHATAPTADPDDVARRLTADGVVGGAEAPGPGIVAGRLVDAVTGLPVADSGVSLLEPGRRAITGADGAFRFEGIGRGDVTLVLGPADGYVTRGTARTVSAQGLDAGLLALLPVGPPTLVDPEFGGEVVGCRSTRLSLPTGSIGEPLPISVTCIDRAAAFPAPPPVGRLPLAVIDIAPGAVPLAQPVPVVAELPAQPRYAPGVVLDLLRLDAVAFAWQEAGSLIVDAGGRTAIGRLPAFGTYLIAAPPFGAFEAHAEARPTIRRYNVAGTPDGAPSDVFPDTTIVVYAAFEYGGMDNTPITIRTVDEEGRVVWEAARPYAREGSDAAPMLAPGSRPWPDGRYTSAWYIGDPPIGVGGDVAWSVVSRPTPVPTPFDDGARVAAAGADAPLSALDPAASDGRFADGNPPGGAARSSGGGAGWPGAAQSSGSASPAGGGCSVPLGWWQYVVRPGDTLFGLSVRFATDAGALSRANCLDGKGLFAGATIYVPQPPSKYLPPWKPGATPIPLLPLPAPIPATPWPTKVTAPEQPTLAPYPTSWYTPPARIAPEPTPGTLPVAPGPAAPGAAPRPPAGQGPGAPSPRPVAPYATPTPEPLKDPSPAQPTLAPRPAP